MLLVPLTACSKVLGCPLSNTWWEMGTSNLVKNLCKKMLLLRSSFAWAYLNNLFNSLLFHLDAGNRI